jgi:hypothetical protein
MGIEGKGDNGLHLQMALIVEEAIEKALAERDSPLSIGDHEIFAFAMVAAEQLTDKFDVKPKT